MSLRGSILWPISLPYGGVAHLRARAYLKGLLKPQRLDGTVISVGNLTVGGTGKTPMVIWLAEKLAEQGKRVGILTRGYRGVTPADGDGAKSTSDEVRMMHARLGGRASFGVGANRFATGSGLGREGVEWFILDDGFQHMQLARDADIVLLDATDPFGGGQLLPAGRLREPRTALGRADLIVITRTSHSPAVEAAVRRDSAAPIFYARAELESVLALPLSEAGDPCEHPVEFDPAKGKLFAFCGIGNPAAFFQNLREWGFQIAGQRAFPDHHRYTQAEVESLAAEAAASGAEGVICTEKDVYNLDGHSWRLRNPLFCRIRLGVDREEEFLQALFAAIGRHRGSKDGDLPHSSSV